MAEARVLSTHLNDHLALATAAVQLARRAAGSMADRPWGPTVTTLSAELETERQAILAVMAAFGVRRDRAKELGAWAGEKAGRLKPNGRLTGRSPLSDVVELEALAMLALALRGFWRGIDAALGGDDDRLAGAVPDARAAAADARLERIEDARDEAAVRALA